MNITLVNAFNDELEKIAGRNPSPLANSKIKPYERALFGVGGALGLAGTALNVEDLVRDIANKSKKRRSRYGLPLTALAASISMPLLVSILSRSKQNKAVKTAIKKEYRDPRLYSNLRGAVTLESRKKRIAAHKRLGKGDGTVLTAAKRGFGRKK